MSLSGYNPMAGLDVLGDMERSNREHLQKIARSTFEHRNPVIQAFASLKEYISNFQASLDDEHEVGASLVSFGQQVTLHVRSVGYSTPAIITFDGVTENGDREQLIQHVSQLSFLLLAVKKLGDQPRRIGFIDTDSAPTK